ncbi:MAG TPA: pyrroline-5-carboxylate reductase [Dehalococcoidia bacterium]|nr:pyrroline-5-carboxylate reductase [Dehalococcoidia bacterium]
MKLAFIGGGAMGEAMVGGLLGNGTAAPDDIVVAEPVADRRTFLEKRYGVRALDDNAGAVTGADLVVLAVKPQSLDDVAPGLWGILQPGQTLLSIMAGVPILRLREAFDHPAVIRVMPNTPAQIGQGMSVWTATETVTPEAREAARRVLGALGREIYVSDEHYLDIATAVSGSGPGYVFLLLEAYIDAAVHVGFSRQQATELVLQTVIGSALYARETGRHPAELRNAVTSPAGTTAAGLYELEKAGLRAAFVEAIVASAERSRALGAVSK